MKTIFISDLHLSINTPKITNNFKHLLAILPKDVEALYILGDLFEVWFGDDAASAFENEIADCLQQLSSKCQIYFLSGNRDFLLGSKYCQKSGMQYLTQPYVINLYGKKTLLLHGDGLCTQDKVFQYYRKIAYSKLFKAFFLALPIKFRKRLAAKMRQRSLQRNQRISTELMDIENKTLFTLMKKHSCEQAIYGHTHRPSIYFRKHSNDFQKIFVLSDWHHNIEILEFDGATMETKLTVWPQN